MTVSPLYFMGHNPELALFTKHQPPLGLALDPATHLRQRSISLRASAFRALPFGRASVAFDPDTSQLSDAQYSDLVVSSLDLARTSGATMFLTAYHLTGAVGTRGRTLDISIARDSIDHFRAQRMDEPPSLAAIPVRRELYVVLAVPAELLESPNERRRLVAAYVDLEADGFWVKIAGFNEHAPRAVIHACGAFLALLDSDGRPVVCDGAGHLHVGLLANNISTSIGLAECERFAPQAVGSGNDWSRGRTRTVYHPNYLRSYRSNGDPAIRAFRAAGCACGAHAAEEPPVGKAIAEHAALVRAREARQALDGEISARREWLMASAAAAAELARRAEVDHTALGLYQALLEGIDSVTLDELEETG